LALSSANLCSQDATLTHFSGYTEEQIQPVFELMVGYLHGPVAHEAFFKKYASKKFLKGKMASYQDIANWY
jgi:G2/mitotic-specific cyclin 1/2